MTKSKSKAVALKNNKNKELSKETSLAVVKEAMSTICDAYAMPKLYQVGILHRAGYKPQDIAVILDTSPRYASNCVTKLRRDSKARATLNEKIESLPELFKTSRQSVLPLLALTQNRALEMCAENPELYLKYPQVGKQVASAAGIHDDVAVTKYINIGVAIQIQNHIDKQQQRAISGGIVEETE